MNIYIILVNYNGYRLTEECINSLQNLKYNDKYNVRIIVVDNGSKIDESKILKEKYKNNTIFIRSEDNLGFSGGNNLGINFALEEGADYILLLNNDTVVDKNMLTRLLQHVDSKTVLTSKVLYYTKPDIIWCEGGTIDWKRGNSYNGKIGEKNENNNERPYYCDFASGCCMLLPRKVIQTVGLLKEDFFMYCEDTEYCLRLKQLGFKIKVIPQSIVYHKVSVSSGGEDSPFSNYYMTRNRLEMIKEHADMFSSNAMKFAIITRYIRMIQFSIKGSKNAKALKYAIRDFKLGKLGKATYSELGI